MEAVAVTAMPWNRRVVVSHVGASTGARQADRPDRQDAEG